MRAVIQRVKEASVEVSGEVVGKIGKGILVLLGIGKGDDERDVDWMVDKVINLRIFEAQEGKMDLSLLDVSGELLVVSQFTLYGDCTRGRRPSFTMAMEKEKARDLFERFVNLARGRIGKVETGVFSAHMNVSLVNDGPVTLILDSKACN